MPSSVICQNLTTWVRINFNIVQCYVGVEAATTSGTKNKPIRSCFSYCHLTVFPICYIYALLPLLYPSPIGPDQSKAKSSIVSQTSRFSKHCRLKDICKISYEVCQLNMSTRLPDGYFTQAFAISYFNHIRSW